MRSPCFAKACHPELVEGSVPWVAVAGSATVRRRVCAGYLGGHRPPLQAELIPRQARDDRAFGLLGFPWRARLLPGRGRPGGRPSDKIWHTGLLIGVGWCAFALSVFGATDPVSPDLQAVSFRGDNYLIRTVDPRKDDLRLYWKDDQGNLLRDFTSLEKFVRSKGERLVFAANAGMFEPDSRPVGLLVQNGVQQSPLNLNDGAGNFYLKPNGVFLINEKHGALIVESSAYTALLSPVVWATQSGPLLVQRGDIHPDFIEGSKNKKERSGVGVRKDGTVVFALSKQMVTFYDFASLFLARLKCPDALFLDGDISAFYTAGMIDDKAHSFTAMFGLVEKVKTP